MKKEKILVILKEVPIEVRNFLIKAAFLFVVWKLSYYLILKPHRTIDKPLTIQVTKSTAQVLKSIYPTSVFSIIEKKLTSEIDFYGLIILKDGKKILGIADPCNALELIVLFVGFLICISSNKWKRTIIFGLLGILIIYVCNVLRCSFIGYLNISSSSYVEIAHHYIFKLIMYFIIFAMWVWYLKAKTPNNEQI